MPEHQHREKPKYVYSIETAEVSEITAIKKAAEHIVACSQRIQMPGLFPKDPKAGGCAGARPTVLGMVSSTHLPTRQADRLGGGQAVRDHPSVSAKTHGMGTRQFPKDQPASAGLDYPQRM